MAERAGHDEVAVQSRDDACALAEKVRNRDVSAAEVCEAALERATADRLGCFWELASDQALADAAEVDRRIAQGEAPALAGVPVAVKDCFDVAGLRTTAGVRRSPPPAAAETDAVAVSGLRDEGAVVIGKAAMHQLAWGMSGQAPGFPVSRNPADPSRQPGGSSSGSAAAVGADIVPLALGTDAGGSVRQPAAWCGAAGFKPTLGLVPLEGCAPMAKSLDTCGVLARSVRDCRASLRALAAAPKADPAEPPRVGVLESAFGSVDPGVERVCRDVLMAWEHDGGATLRRLELVWERRALGRIYAAELAEVWGPQVDEDPSLFEEDVRSGIEAGREVSPTDYGEAIGMLDRLRVEWVEPMAEIDVVVCPTCPTLAPSLSEPDDVTLAGRNTRIFNGLGWPSISVPCGTVEGLPVGFMLSALPGCDMELLAHAERLEGILS